MLDAYKHGKDLYSEIAALAFDRKYEDCLEFYLDENGNKTDKTNKEGKSYRTQAKSILLGILYGRGITSVAEQLKCSKQKAQQIQDKVFKGFPAIRKFDEDSKQMAREKGFVTTLWGRKRRLPDMQLESYEFDFSNFVSEDFDPLLFDDTNSDLVRQEVEAQAIDHYIELLDKAWGRQAKEGIKSQARKEGITIKDNGGFIAEAERQCVNSRIQRFSSRYDKKSNDINR